MDPILLRGARQNNLKGFDLALSPGEVLVITGRSGAGKSSLALDTLYAEGQRRYIESFSPYARQFLDRSQRPELEELTAALPAIAVDRTAPARSGRSTVATRTEIADHVKLLFARAASGSCQRCGGPVVAQRPESIAAQLLKDHPEQRAVIWLPQGGVDSVEGLLEARDTLLPLGFARVIRGRSFADLDDLRPSDLVEVVHGGELKVVVDRLVLRPSERDRLVEALESALRFGPGELGVDIDGGEAIRTARGWRCERCGRAHQEPSAGLFSFNNPIGACERCSGFGRDVELDPDKVVDDPSKTLDQQALRPFRGPKRDWERAELARLCHRHGIPTDRPWSELSAEHRRLLWHGEGRGRGRWFGVTGWFEWMESRSYKAHVRIQLARYRRYVPCEACGGSRFSPETLRYRLGGLTLPELYGLDCEQARAHLRQLPSRDDPAVAVLLDEILSRLDFLCDVGLSYLSLDRMSRTLSGGEAQRVGLATVLGASLSGTLLVVDEPTAGLHPADVPRLMGVIRRLARAGNALVVVDNHPAVISQADRVADLGPGAGAAGGELVYSGPVAGLAEVDRGATAAMLRPQPAPSPQRREPQRWLTVRGARAHNLRDIDVALPLGLLTVVSGASGSGKSTLVEQVLVRGLLRGRGETTDQPGEHDGIDGGEELTEVVVMDQSPLGRTSRGNPATYVKAWDVLRTRLAKQEAALEAGLSASSFSFNVAGGRCETCRGEGVEVVEMQFLPDIRLPCPSCGGRRFKDEVLAVTFAGRTVAQLLDTTAEELIELCPKDKLLGRRLEPLIAVGLGYLRLGQPLDTLSDGEAQRLKVARSLGTVSEGALVVLDEPTVGLHPADVEPLIAALERLVARGCTVVTVSHDLTLAASADWMIDLGPGGGRDGGQLVASGPPEAVAASEDGRTGSLLRARLAGEPMVLVEDRQLEAPQPSGRRSILVRGARQHNLRHLDLEVPLSEVCVVTGPSGSGKSTLAFDVIHAEGQRRFLQALSPYVRQYLRQLPRPEVDSVDGVPPSIALEPRSTAAGGATVATLTEVGHHLRLLFARAGIQRCPDCQVKAGARTRAEIVEVVSRELERGPRSLLARVIEHRKGTHKDVMGRARTLGLERLRVDGELFPATNPPKLARYREHDVDYEVARLESRAGVDRGVGQALSLGRGTVRLTGGDGELILSTSRSCPSCGRGFPELDPTVFTHHSPHAACPECQGLGWVASIDHEAVFDDDRPLGDGGLRLFAFPAFRRFLGRRLRRITSIPLSKRYGELDDSQRQWLLRGRGRWPGVIQAVAQLDDRGIAAVEGMLTRERCEACGGSRLAPEPRNVILGADDTSFLDVLSQSVSTARRWFEELELGERQRVVGEDLRRQVSRRLAFLEDTGVGYLTLDRPAETLSGGETQRVRLAAQLGSGLTGVCYVLDEPTIGLHPRDTARLISILRRLSTLGASVLVVEHDEQVIRAADHVIDLGPGGGDGWRSDHGHRLARGDHRLRRLGDRGDARLPEDARRAGAARRRRRRRVAPARGGERPQPA